ncbi:hypothetical protein BCR34DRAFT_590959 [Clohesyomyces aquaticus]|uniref:PIN domain-like protein n=1 Tax=Clohesyomyces aquaticus TaxID=1231657 RepID=A0A1Y1Z4W9_9PLEO|nr:hypothetical protein BCR34DRAFT_590959 [Clohesyomyces aquaticus]
MTTPCYLRVLAVRKPNSKSADQAHFLAPSRLEDPRRPGRGYARQRHSDSIDYGLLKTWIDDCQSLHPECSRVGNVHNPKDLTTLRYIDCKTREIVPAPEGASYVALSYVWGRSRPYNPESCGKYGSLPEILPAVIHDAIEVTLRLGFRHLWVDKYCIDQSDESDKYNQIAVMDKIYERAEVTVVAAAGEDSFYGLPGVSSRRRTLQPRFNFEEVVWVSCLRDPRILIHESKWSTRAWTYQEGIFSRRRLYFTEEQVYYECQRGGRTEVVEYCVHKGAHEAHFGTSAGPMEDADVYIRKFVDHVDMYTKRNLSWEGDIINGIRGILRSLCGPASPIFHCWGIPIARQSIHHTFVSGLRWKAETRMRRRNGFPSWSWVGWVGSANCPGTPYLDYSDDGTFCKIWFQRPDGSFEPSENCNPPNLGDRDPTALEVNPIIRISADILSLRFNEADVPSLHSNAYTPSRSFHGKILDLLSTPSAYIVNTRMHEKVIWYLSPTAQVSEDDELYREICEEELLGLRLGNFFICVVLLRDSTVPSPIHGSLSPEAAMGVTGLWTVLQPCARPIKIETLNKKRLAVDASIWIYQFLKAVRDKEGNALRNSHIVGFFRRICKLLFFGIKPVFVFDGGAPVLKRQTISNRKSRREGRREDAVRTAGKLLALQMQRAAEEEDKKRKEAMRRHPREEPQEEIPENVVYAEEILQTQQERLQNRKFKKKDQYHLPDLGVPLAEMGGQNDPRIMSLEELEEYARHFDRGEDINVYDFSKIDFDSPFFVSLPASDRYNILNAARLRSRLRMGYSKDQLDTMFPDRMAFSKFQIERVRERNELTQRLMNLNGMNDDAIFSVNGINRVASEKSREYVLVKNDGVEGGWALGVVTNRDEGQSVNKPIDLDRPTLPDVDGDEWDEDDEFEDVPIAGLNRLPKSKPRPTAEEMERRDFISKELAKRRQKLYASRKKNPPQTRPQRAKPISQDPDSLFLAEDDDGNEWENVSDEGEADLFEEVSEEKKVDEEEEQLQQAIALSLQKEVPQPTEEDEEEEEEEDVLREVFHQEKVEQSNPFASARGSGLAIARLANQRSTKLAPKGPFNISDSEDDEMDLEAALAESRNSKRATTAPRLAPTIPADKVPPTLPTRKPTNAPGFDGPLPFEKLNLGNSILGKKKMQQIEQDTSGGFERDLGSDIKKKSAEPMPPWFTGERDIQKDMDDLREAEKRAQERDRKAEEEHAQFQFQQLPSLRKEETHDFIDLESPSTQEKPKVILTLDSDSEVEDMEMEDVLVEDPKLRVGDLADKVRVETPQPPPESFPSPPKQAVASTEAIAVQQSDDEPVEWSESDPEPERTVPLPLKLTKQPDVPVEHTSKSPSLEFEDVLPEAERIPRRPRRPSPPVFLEGPEDLETPIVPISGVADEDALPDDPENDSDQYSDPEDAELFASLAAEAQEHNRFAQELNNNQAAPINFDAELKQLRAQQKKDRRDADEVTQTMIAECQHLLTLFGLPYITAPMEAEAQCAELVHLGLVDGIVTDDSDTFLFGGTRVYKNMFNAAKFVECYLSNDLTSEFSLSREKLIAIAQLLGSDYTTGIPGIGPVTALEILSEFNDLDEFKEWWTGVQNNTISKDADKASQFRRRFRRTQAMKLFLPTNFPDPRVHDAYLNPDVDRDPQPFQWGVPDLDALRTFLSSQIGWSWERTDEVLVPVIKDMNRREKEGTQSNITRFFDGVVGAGAFAPRVRSEQSGHANGRKKGKGAAGKRLGAALTRLAEREQGGRAGDEEQGGEDGEQEYGVGVGETAPSNEGGKRKKQGRVRKAASGVADNKDNDEEDVEMNEGEDEDGDDLESVPFRREQSFHKSCCEVRTALQTRVRTLRGGANPRWPAFMLFTIARDEIETTYLIFPA